MERNVGRALASSSLGSAIEMAIRGALPLAVAPADLAKSLHLSERSLRRQLSQAGLSFRSVLDKVRKQVALELMTEGKCRLSDVAMRTGFSDVRAFSRAFKRWTGTPPSALLQALRAANVAAAAGRPST